MDAIQKDSGKIQDEKARVSSKQTEKKEDIAAAPQVVCKLAVQNEQTSNHKETPRSERRKRYQEIAGGFSALNP